MHYLRSLHIPKVPRTARGPPVDADCNFMECWLADFCLDEGITFVLRSRLTLNAIQSDKVEKEKIEQLNQSISIRSPT